MKTKVTTRAEVRRWRQPAPLVVGHLLLLACTAVAVYAGSLAVPFVSDDNGAIVDNPHIAHLWSLAHRFATTPASSVAGRPVAGWSLALNYAVDGLRPAGYHLFNLAVHLAAAGLLYGIVRRTLRQTTDAALRSSPAAEWIACVVALIWLVHPIQTEVIDYVSQRTESLMGLFYLSTLYATVRVVTSGGRGRRWRVLAVVSCGLGMACKESMVTAPLMVALWDVVFGGGTVAAAWRARRGFYAAFGSTWAIALWLVSQAPRAGSAGFSSGVAPGTYLLNQAPIIVHYLRLSVWPVGLVHDYGPVPPAVTLADVWPAAAFLITLVVLVVAAWRWDRRLAYLGTWFFVTLAPASSVLPIATEVGAERRMYLPLAALVALAVVVVYQGVAKATTRPWVVAMPLGATTIVLLAVVSLARTREYQDPERLWQGVLLRRPHARAHLQLGLVYRDRRQTDLAIGEFRRAAPEDPQAAYALGVTFYETGHPEAAIEPLMHYVAQASTDVNVPRAEIYLSRSFGKGRRWPEAEQAARRAIRMRPNDSEAHGVLGESLFGQRRFREAADEFEQRVRLSPGDAATELNLGLSYLNDGRSEQAVAPLRRAVALAPGDAMSYVTLGSALVNLDRIDEAIAVYRAGVAAAPRSVALHNVLALSLAAIGERDAAEQEFKRSLVIEPQNARTRSDYQAFLGQEPRRAVAR